MVEIVVDVDGVEEKGDQFAARTLLGASADDPVELVLGTIPPNVVGEEVAEM
jgi:hypothetical protein